MSINSVQIARFAGALYGISLDAPSLTDVNNAVNSMGMSTFLNDVFQADFSTMTDAQVSAIITANLGISGSLGTIVQQFITNTLDATPVGNKGAEIMTLLNNFAALQNDPTWGVYATAWENTVANSVTYGQNPNNVVNQSIQYVASLPHTFNLTTGVDNLVGNATWSNEFVGGSGSLTPLDTITGAGSNNMLSLTDTGAISIPVSATVTGVQNATITSASTVSGDFNPWTGLVNLNINEYGGTGASGVNIGSATSLVLTDKLLAGGTIAVTGGGTGINVGATGITSGGAIDVGNSIASPTGVVSISAQEGNVTANTIGDQINVTGGSSVSISSTSPNVAVNTTFTNGAISVTGNSSTKSVSITESTPSTASATTNGIVDGTVTINDASAGSTTAFGTISSVSLSNVGNTAISSNALTSLNLSGNTGTIGLTEGLLNSSNTSLGISLANVRSSNNTITDNSNQFKTIDLNVGGVGYSVLTNIVDSAATTLNITGNEQLEMSNPTGLSALTTISISGGGALNGDYSGLSTLTDINASTSTGPNVLTINDTKTSFEGGSGLNQITINAAPTKLIAGGSNLSNELILNASSAVISNPGTNADLTGFHNLGFGVNATGAYNVSGFGNISVDAGIAGPLTLNSPTLSVLNLLGDPGAGNSITVNNTTTASLTLELNATTSFNSETINLPNVNQLNIVSNDASNTGTTAIHTDTVTVVDSANTVNTSVTLSGNTNINLNLSSTGVTLIDATNLNGGLTTTASGTSPEMIIGGTGANNLTAATGAVADTLIGHGNSILTSNAGLDVLTGGVSSTGANTYNINGIGANGNIYSTITDFTVKNDVLSLNVDANTLIKGINITSQLGNTAVFQDYLNAAVNDAGANAHTVNWFQWNGDTYVVDAANTTASSSFINGTDIVVKLSGVVDLSTATFSGHTITHA
jgi:S-layer protein